MFWSVHVYYPGGTLTKEVVADLKRAIRSFLNDEGSVMDALPQNPANPNCEFRFQRAAEWDEGPKSIVVTLTPVDRNGSNWTFPLASETVADAVVKLAEVLHGRCQGEELKLDLRIGNVPLVNARAFVRLKPTKTQTYIGRVALERSSRGVD